jgi:hypothetical protein
MSSQTETQDPGVPTLPQALDTEAIIPVLVQAGRLHPEDARQMRCTAQVLSHKLGRRCTIRYTLTWARGSGQPTHVVAFVGKVYSKSEHAGRLYNRTVGLRNGPFHNGGPLSIPAPLLLVPHLKLVLQEYVAAPDLRQALSDGSDGDPLSRAAQWLATLHAAAPVAGLKNISLDDERARVDRWCDDIAPCLGTTDALRLRGAQQTLRRIADKMSPCRPVMIHRDYYYGNVLWDGARGWVVDFDELAIGDPALDLGHFQAHLAYLAYRVTGQVDTFSPAADHFLRSYRERIALDLEARLPFYKAYTFLKLAATTASRQRGEWEQVTHVLTNLAIQALDDRH